MRKASDCPYFQLTPSVRSKAQAIERGAQAGRAGGDTGIDDNRGSEGRVADDKNT